MGFDWLYDLAGLADGLLAGGLAGAGLAVACDRYVVPAMALLAVAFGCWYAGLTA